jgi:hypothetical protein
LFHEVERTTSSNGFFNRRVWPIGKILTPFPSWDFAIEEIGGRGGIDSDSEMEFTWSGYR